MVVGGGPARMITLLAEPGSLVAGASVMLRQEESHHLRVRRGEPGSPVRLVDGAGAVGIGRVVRQGKHTVAAIERVEQQPRGPAVTLAVGAGDRDRFAVVVEKASEFGVTEVIPLETERTGGVAGRVRPGSAARLERRALEGIKQSGAAWAPRVREPEPLALFAATPPPGARWLGDPAGGAPPALAPGDPITLAVGPEGGFTEAERATLLAAGFHPVRLGPHILRFETAAIAALTMAWQARQRERHG
jgi:16S rRNA (uracil1498-N3)-methyltransferase